MGEGALKQVEKRTIPTDGEDSRKPMEVKDESNSLARIPANYC